MSKNKKNTLSGIAKTPEIKNTGSKDLVKVKILAPLYNPYNISGRHGDIKEIPAALVDELVKLNKIELI